MGSMASYVLAKPDILNQLFLIRAVPEDALLPVITDRIVAAPVSTMWRINTFGIHLLRGGVTPTLFSFHNFRPESFQVVPDTLGKIPVLLAGIVVDRLNLSFRENIATN